MMIHEDLLEQLEQKRKERDLQIKAMTRRAKVDTTSMKRSYARSISKEIEFTEGESEGLNFMSNLTMDNAIDSFRGSTKSINKSSNTLSSKSLSDPSSNNIILSQVRII